MPAKRLPQSRRASFMCCLCAVSLRNFSDRGGLKRHRRKGDLNGLAYYGDNPSNSLGFFQALPEFKSLFPLLSLGKAEVFFVFCSPRLRLRSSRQHSVNHALRYKVANGDGHSVRRRAQPRHLHVRVNLLRELEVAVATIFFSLSKWHACDVE